MHEGPGALEIVPYAHLASVRVAFERDAGKLGWALARLLPPLAALLGAAALALAVLFALGRTTLTLSFAATERAFARLGRNRALIEFAEILGERLAERASVAERAN